MTVTTYRELAARAGGDIGVSSWITVDQAMIDKFAGVTGDDGFIHVDPARAAGTPFGTTIAHGLLLLSLTSAMLHEVLPQISDRAYLLNYGYDRVRFLAPLASNARARGRIALKQAIERGQKERLLSLSITVESDAADRPVLVADLLLMVVLK